MYNDRKFTPRNSPRPYSGGSSRNSPRGNGFGGNRGGGGGRSRQRFGSKIDHAQYVRKISDLPKFEEEKIENSFDDFKLDAQLRKNIEAKGFDIPTPIQSKCIPLIIEKRDVIGLAGTGTGKTGAFLIPLVNAALLDKNQKTLIIAPTRELATQIHKEFLYLVRNTRVYAALCIGGESMTRQRYAISKRPQFIIATPGRLLDHSRTRVINLSEYNNIVLDEVDVMFDMGFIEDIKYVISMLPENRRMLFFSATMNPKIERLAQSILRNPVKISVRASTASELVDQDVVKFKDKEDKFKKLNEILVTDEQIKVIIFVNTKISVDDLKKKLMFNNIQSESIHGDKRQNERRRAIENFSAGRVKILVATDVAARGLDIQNVSHVINYDEPSDYQNFIHRIGRTGRAGKLGKALTFIPHMNY